MSFLLVLLVILPPIDWIAAVLCLALWQLAKPRSVALRERAVTAAVLALIATVAGALAWTWIVRLDVDGESMLTVIAALLVVVSLPNLYWLGLVFTGRFRDGGVL